MSVTSNELKVAESTSVSVPTGAISTGVCSVNAVVTSWPAPPAFRSTTGASFTAVTVRETDALICSAPPVPVLPWSLTTICKVSAPLKLALPW